MFSAAVRGFVPCTWLDVDDANNFRQVQLSQLSFEYKRLSMCLSFSFCEKIERIVQVENQFLFGHFLLKKAEYESRGNASIKEFYHCTGDYKITSIISTNLDWRMARRVKFGRGVSFSSSTSYADKEASKDNGNCRAMIVADVLVGRVQNVAGSCELPNEGYDTTRGNGDNVYVKFYDNEFYPKYVIYYKRK